MRCYFYCPHCGNEYEEQRLPTGTVPNIRDGFGRPIYHYECAKCGNLDSGFMCYSSEDDCRGWCYDDAKKYFRKVIALYQGVRGFSISPS